MANNPPLRMNGRRRLTNNLDWTHPKLTAGLVNVQGYDRSTRSWNDV